MRARNIIIETATIVTILSISSSAAAINLDAIKTIESSNRKFAQSYCGKGYFQLTEICVEDYNIFHSEKINYNSTSIYDYAIQYKVAEWYLHVRIPQLLKHYDLEVSDDNILMAYNWGIGNVLKFHRGNARVPQETKNYLTKYQKLTAQGLPRNGKSLASPTSVSVNER